MTYIPYSDFGSSKTRIEIPTLTLTTTACSSSSRSVTSVTRHGSSIPNSRAYRVRSCIATLYKPRSVDGNQKSRLPLLIGPTQKPEEPEFLPATGTVCRSDRPRFRGNGADRRRSGGHRRQGRISSEILGPVRPGHTAVGHDSHRRFLRDRARAADARVQVKASADRAWRREL